MPFGGVPTISLGTSGVLMYSSEGVDLPAVGKPVLFKWGNTLKTQIQLSIRSCGGAKEWWYGQILSSESYDLEDKAVEDPFYDMRDLMFYPIYREKKSCTVARRYAVPFWGLILTRLVPSSKGL